MRKREARGKQTKKERPDEGALAMTDVLPLAQALEVDRGG